MKNSLCVLLEFDLTCCRLFSLGDVGTLDETVPSLAASGTVIKALAFLLASDLSRKGRQSLEPARLLVSSHILFSPEDCAAAVTLTNEQKEL